MKIGVLGGGQLGRMLALAGHPLGLQFRFLDPAPDAPSRHLGEFHQAGYEDQAALARFADGLAVVTYEFENVPVVAARWLAERWPVYPPPRALEVAQDRLREKQFFERHGVPTNAFAAAGSRDEFDAALARIGLPAVVKTRRLGYDGKGQRVVRSPADAEAAWQALVPAPLLVESFVPFEREISVIAVRGRGGAIATYPLVQNRHEQGILAESIAPAPDVGGDLQTQATRHATALLNAFGYVGVLTIEFFVQSGRLIANEIAPRVHNSGHWTIEGARTSQFENHLRAVAGLPLGPTDAVGCSVMRNLIGTAPDLAQLLALPNAHPHLYGKAPRPGRKLGHVTFWGEELEVLRRQAGTISAS